jgi:hypothetical protein
MIKTPQKSHQIAVDTLTSKAAQPLSKHFSQTPVVKPSFPLNPETNDYFMNFTGHSIDYNAGI